MSVLNGRRVSAGVLLLLVCLVGLVLAFRSGPIGIDRAVMTWFVDHRSHAAVPAVSAFSDLFGPLLVAVWTLAIAVLFFLRDRTVGRSTAIVAGVACAAVVTEVVKLVVARPRPPMIDHVGISEMTYSYPSGHVTGTTALALTTAVVATATSGRRAKVWAVSVAALVGVIGAATRLYLGVHWFSDVLAAFAVATASALVVPGATDAALREIRRRLPATPPDWLAPATRQAVPTRGR
ncbi:phosphatase PAP2 family protein [Gordonia sp. VNQ95]|jgi:undecaprenyl-diphosphatase|uniref:phosphatase PAP2 family protein n=1 Tax=Gordonia TaxID=2053 RepID=UPI0032B4AF20